MARTDKLAEAHERLTRAVEEIVSGEESGSRCLLLQRDFTATQVA